MRIDDVCDLNEALRARLPAASAPMWRAESIGTGKWVLPNRSEAMKRLVKSLSRLVRDEQGTETLEWGLVCGLIVVGAIVAITSIGPKVEAMWNNVDSEIPTP